MPNINELVTSNKNREQIYTFLSKIYQVELTEELIERVRAGEGPLVDTHTFEGVDDADVKEGFALLTRAVSAMKGRKLKDVWTDLASDFAGIFLGVKYDILPHPSESAYSNREHLVYQKSRDEVMKYYRQAGLDKVTSFTEPEDHVAIEFAFMSLLARQTAEALQASNVEEARRLIEVQKKFLSEHLTPWIPNMCRDILKAARLDFYKGIARLTRGFISVDPTLLEEMSEKLTKS